MFDRDASVGYVVNLTARRMVLALGEQLRPHGMQVGQFPILLCLWSREGLTQRDLAHELALEQPTVANTLKRMERDGLIYRKPDPCDERRALIFLTELGQTIQPHAVQCAIDINTQACEGLSASEVRTLLRLLHKVLANMS